MHFMGALRRCSIIQRICIRVRLLCDWSRMAKHFKNSEPVDGAMPSDELGNNPSSDNGNDGFGPEPFSGPNPYSEPAPHSAPVYVDFPVGSGSDDQLIRHKHRRHKHRGLKMALGVVGVLVVLSAAGAAALASSASDLKTQASSALSEVNAVQSAIESQDFAAASASAQELQNVAAQMNGSLQSPLWSFASALPVVGGDVSAVRTVASVLQDASTNALVPLTDALAQTPVDSLVSDGTIDVQSLSGLLSAVEQTAPVMQRCTDSLDSLPEMHIEKLQSMIQPAREKLDGVNDMFQSAATLAPVAGNLLGANGDRTYMLAAQNTAELRASDGFPGSVGTLSISNGHISLGDFAKVYDVLNEDTPSSAGITDEEHALFYDYTRYSWDNSFNPDFSRVGGIWAASYEERNGGHLDGVVSITPSVVQRMLAALGTSVTLSDGTELDGTNATKVLEHDLYWKYLSAGDNMALGGDITDALFAEAAKLTFDQVLGNFNSDTLSKLATVLMDGAKDREVLIWMADSNEQSAMEKMGVTGTLDASTQQQPTLGVFANIWFGSKIGWWFGMSTQVGDVQKAADGTRTYHVTTTLENYLTQDELATGGDYILGGIDKSSGYYEPFIYLYAPAGGTIQNLQASNGASFSTTEYRGLQVTYTQDVSGDPVWPRPSNPLYPGQPATISYDVVLPASVSGELAVSSVPTLQQYR